MLFHFELWMVKQARTHTLKRNRALIRNSPAFRLTWPSLKQPMNTTNCTFRVYTCSQSVVLSHLPRSARSYIMLIIFWAFFSPMHNCFVGIGAFSRLHSSSVLCVRLLFSAVIFSTHGIQWFYSVWQRFVFPLALSICCCCVCHRACLRRRSPLFIPISPLSFIFSILKHDLLHRAHRLMRLSVFFSLFSVFRIP